MKVCIDTFSIKLQRFFTDVNGTLVDKNILPNVLKTKYPFALFCDYDQVGGYKKLFQINPPQNNTYYLCSFVYQGDGVPFLEQSGFNEVEQYFNVGDIVHLFTDSIQAPNYYIWVSQNNAEVSVKSIISSLDEKTYLESFNYFADNDLQYNEALRCVRLKRFGTLKEDQVNPLTFKTSQQYQNGFINIKIRSQLDRFFGITSFFAFNSEAISFDFNVYNI